MTVEQITSFTIKDLRSVSVRCARCGANTDIPLTALADSVGFGSGPPPVATRPIDRALLRAAKCVCGEQLWPGPPEPDPVRDFIRALLDARQRGTALNAVRLNAPSEKARAAK
jgi:hypothetical protein